MVPAQVTAVENPQARAAQSQRDAVMKPKLEEETPSTNCRMQAATIISLREIREPGDLLKILTEAGLTEAGLAEPAGSPSTMT